MLFRWNSSTALHSFAPGNIFVEATSVRQARQIAIQDFEKYFQEELSWLLDDQEELNKYRSKLLIDLQAEPEMIQLAAVFIRGSD